MQGTRALNSFRFYFLAPGGRGCGFLRLHIAHARIVSSDPLLRSAGSLGTKTSLFGFILLGNATVTVRHHDLMDETSSWNFARSSGMK
jgi:hypothetical protein